MPTGASTILGSALANSSYYNSQGYHAAMGAQQAQANMNALAAQQQANALRNTIVDNGLLGGTFYSPLGASRLALHTCEYCRRSYSAKHPDTCVGCEAPLN